MQKRHFASVLMVIFHGSLFLSVENNQSAKLFDGSEASEICFFERISVRYAASLFSAAVYPSKIETQGQV